MVFDHDEREQLCVEPSTLAMPATASIHGDNTGHEGASFVRDQGTDRDRFDDLTSGALGSPTRNSAGLPFPRTPPHSGQRPACEHAFRTSLRRKGGAGRAADPGEDVVRPAQRHQAVLPRAGGRTAKCRSVQ
jgi:hypothetical protein